MGKTEMKDAFLNEVRAMYFTHPKRPKLHTVGINCVPRRLTWQGMQAMALLTQAKFRPVCLEQANIDSAPPPGGMPVESTLWAGVDLAQPILELPEGATDEDEAGGSDEREYEPF